MTADGAPVRKSEQSVHFTVMVFGIKQDPFRCRGKAWRLKKFGEVIDEDVASAGPDATEFVVPGDLEKDAIARNERGRAT